MTNVTPIRKLDPKQERRRFAAAALREIEAVERAAPWLTKDAPPGRVY